MCYFVCKSNLQMVGLFREAILALCRFVPQKGANYESYNDRSITI